MNIRVTGEDGLTLSFLNELNLKRYILNKYNKSDKIKRCFFRSSFGRKATTDKKGLSCQFGEFDFIISTNNNIILGESKWDESLNASGNKIIIEEKQFIRNETLIKYIEHYNSNVKYRKNKDSLFLDIDKKLEIINKKHPKSTTKLSDVIFNTVRDIGMKRERSIINILLLFKNKNNNKKYEIKNNKYHWEIIEVINESAYKIINI